ncbi:hypothetical protein P9E91_18285, partial [Bacillus velezensis]|nr:hypothetical protein [Bacillus velezensis]
YTRWSMKIHLILVGSVSLLYYLRQKISSIPLTKALLICRSQLILRWPGLRQECPWILPVLQS